MDRSKSNNELLRLLGVLMLRHPEQRFSQILANYGFVKAERPANPNNRISWQNEFYSEPEDILERVRQRIKDVEGINNVG